MLDREAVVWAYRLLLNREPDSEEAIKEHQHAKDLRELLKRFLRSSEFVVDGHPDRRFLELFQNKDAHPRPGFVTDFLGTRIRTSSLWSEAKSLDGKLLGLPIPGDFQAETIEWVGTLSSVADAQVRYRAMELGAGFGPWVVAAGNAARGRGISDIKLYAVEGSPQRYATLVQHFEDNAFPPSDHILLNAAVGTADGEVHWPASDDPLNDSGSRPLADGTSKDYRGIDFNIINVRMIAFGDLLKREPIWDLIHIDIQGHEFDVCQSCISELNERARWLVIGTHSRKIDGDLIELFCLEGWILKDETPCKFQHGIERPESLEALSIADGTQIWLNPRRALSGGM